jgi:glycosyltransferase involved in cell wall biosynthesis
MKAKEAGGGGGAAADAAPLSVGFVGPLPPTRSGIADYDSEILSSLSRKSSLSISSYEPADASKAAAGGHDVLLFQIGNDPLHAPSVEALCAPGRTTPAVVVLHDFVLHHLFAAAYLDRGREADYVRALEAAHGARGRAFAEQGRRGPRIPVWDLDPWAFPMSAGVVRAADAVVAHSALVRGAVLRECPKARVVEIPHHAVEAPRTPRDEARRALGLPMERPVAASLGVVTPAKRIGKILEALAALSAERRPFLFVGGAVGNDDPLHRYVDAHGLAGDVVFGGYLSDGDFWRAASAADFGVNLRHPTMGETSGAVCRLAGFGLPLVVSDTGWFRELPDTFASRVPVGGSEIAALAAEMERLAFDSEQTRVRAAAAVRWGEERRPDRIAEAYADVLREAADGLARPRGLAGFVANGLVDLGVGRPGPFGATSREPDAALVAAVAARVAPLLPQTAEERRFS